MQDNYGLDAANLIHPSWILKVYFVNTKPSPTRGTPIASKPFSREKLVGVGLQTGGDPIFNDSTALWSDVVGFPQPQPS